MHVLGWVEYPVAATPLLAAVLALAALMQVINLPDALRHTHGDVRSIVKLFGRLIGRRKYLDWFNIRPGDVTGDISSAEVEANSYA